MVDDDDYVTPDCDYPPSQRIYHSVYENRSVSNQVLSLFKDMRGFTVEIIHKFLYVMAITLGLFKCKEDFFEFL